MSKVEKFSRIIVKRTIVDSLEPTIPLSQNEEIDDHTTLPKWETTDIYVGEFFLNEIDEKLWIRTNNNNIKQIPFCDDGVTEDIPVAKVGGGIRTLQFVNGLLVGYIDS